MNRLLLTRRSQVIFVLSRHVCNKFSYLLQILRKRISASHSVERQQRHSKVVSEMFAKNSPALQ